MRMTIEEAMENIHAIQAYYNDDMEDSYIGFAKEDNESVDIAIDTMRKYQKIEQLIADYEEYEWETIDIKDIRGIIDGNVD